MLLYVRQAKIIIRPEWTAVPALESMMQIVARTSSRIFVGLPLCMEFYCLSCASAHNKPGRDPEFLNISINYTTDVVITGLILNMVPGPLRP